MSADDHNNTRPSKDADKGGALFATIHHQSDGRPDGYTAEDIAELNSLANRSRQKALSKHWELYLAGSGVALVAALLLGAAWLSPTWMPGRIVKAAEIGDRSKLEHLVDFTAIQTALKTDVQDLMKASYRNEIAATGDPFAMLLSGMGDSFVEATADSLVDQLVTPLALEKAARGEDIQFNLLGETSSAFPDFRHVRDGVPSFTVKGRYLTFSRYEFTLRAIGTDQRFDVQMRRTGPFSWQIERVRLDPEWGQKLVNRPSGSQPPTPYEVEAPVEAEVERAPYAEGAPLPSEAQPYSTFRSSLQSAGFNPIAQPRSGSEMFCGTEYLDEGEPDLCVVYPELEDCGGSGVRPCNFLFSRTTDGRTLVVHTGGELNSQITVSSTEWRD